MAALRTAIQNANAELQGGKTLQQIHSETAIVWLGRAIAAYQMRRDAWAEDFAHESLEHAALSEDPPGLVEYVYRNLPFRPGMVP